ncbi:M48 family metallopeptidase [Corynebacterium sp. NML120713]|uniref:M48 metallopeptidase family protein n=1 Tax=Corynebacterium sp. NML120713 TaxID=1906332 RepID=UPI0008FADC8A|nr:YgjP-like metallopeptidase domain-containing protein [Corynebacterium sp. NML120713]OIR44283.1 metal-dependent hydrolase [Corynebacterium sp. NML120713]
MQESEFEYRVIRSPRRTRTVQARLIDGVVEVRIPARFSEREEREAVAEMLLKIRKKTRHQHVSDADLQARAEALNEQVLEGRAKVGSIRWVSNQTKRWGSCTPSTGTIRISDRLQHVPGYVLDAVIVHELTHTFIPGHGPTFWEWADKAPLAERAKGYLEAYQRFGGEG